MQAIVIKDTDMSNYDHKQRPLTREEKLLILDKITRTVNNARRWKREQIQMQAIREQDERIELHREGFSIAARHIDRGFIYFNDFAQMMVDYFGVSIIPYLKGYYLALSFRSDEEKHWDLPTPPNEVDEFDLSTIYDQSNFMGMGTWEEIVNK